MVDSGYADTEYPKFDGAFQTTNDERAGYCPASPATRTGATTRLVKRLFYRLPANYAGSTILSAQFQVSLTQRLEQDPAQHLPLPHGRPESARRRTGPTSRRWSERSPGDQVARGRTGVLVDHPQHRLRRHRGGPRAATIATENTFGIRAATRATHHYKRFCENALLG